MLQNVCSLIVVLMLVYIAVALAVNSLAPGGITKLLMSCRRSLESLI